MVTKTAIENFKTIPYIKVERLVDGRTVNLMPLWDGKNWHMWIPTPSGFMGGIHGGNRAFYSIAADAIQMPPFESFQDADSYYATLAHGCTHWTGSKTRLDRDFGGHRFGSEGYAVEELVAELGAAFLCADLEIALEPREDHASYIATWLRVLAADNRAVFTAAAHAQRAAEFINRKATASAQVNSTCAA